MVRRGPARNGFCARDNVTGYFLLKTKRRIGMAVTVRAAAATPFHPNIASPVAVAIEKISVRTMLLASVPLPIAMPRIVFAIRMIHSPAKISPTMTSQSGIMFSIRIPIRFITVSPFSNSKSL